MPENHKRPPCPETCPNFGGHPSTRTDNSDVFMAAKGTNNRYAAREKEFDERVKACVPKPGGHEQMPVPEDFIKHDGKRLYTVTTMAASISFGGTRTVAVCDSFERAKEMIEHNEGDLWEHSYMLAVIEPVAANWLYYVFPDERYWYRWNLERACYEPIEVPPGYESMFCFGIG
jgi:hypothetical protein